MKQVYPLLSRLKQLHMSCTYARAVNTATITMAACWFWDTSLTLPKNNKTHNGHLLVFPLSGSRAKTACSPRVFILSIKFAPVNSYRKSGNFVSAPNPPTPSHICVNCAKYLILVQKLTHSIFESVGAHSSRWLTGF